MSESKHPTSKVGHKYQTLLSAAGYQTFADTNAQCQSNQPLSVFVLYLRYRKNSAGSPLKVKEQLFESTPKNMIYINMQTCHML